jgi:putative hydrolase of the HAD superfamily
MQTRAVFFDLGGTLVNLDGFDRQMGATVFEFAGTFGLDRSPNDLLTALRAAAAQTMRDFTARPFYRFREVFEESFRLTFAPLGVALSEIQAAAMYADLVARLTASPPIPMDGAHQTLTSLRERGLVTGIVSNADSDTFPLALATFGVNGEVDFALCSEEAGSCKPDAGIFREALRRAGCAADEALFVGDQPEQDIAGANRAGLCAVLYAGPGAALAGHIDRTSLCGEAQPRHTIKRLDEVLGLIDSASKGASPR